jgi:ppGpp synthetase/RelA/SpoT-type nucleotidyltranferase
LVLFALRDRVLETKALRKLIHSIKWREKDLPSFQHKIERKMREATAEKPFDITPVNLFERINDLIGLRILHLHTRQMEGINRELLAALDEALVTVKEGPTAKTWDSETARYFKNLGFLNEDSESMYTSVHYVVVSNTKTKYTCEIQVRTLAEELWGEVSHSFDYPNPTHSVACAEQIKVLARVTSSCTRLVDSVYRSLEEFNAGKGKAPAGEKRARHRARRGRSKNRADSP